MPLDNGFTADEYRGAAIALKKASADGTCLFNFFTSREEGIMPTNLHSPCFVVWSPE